jgi:hypothetical protein
MSQCRAFKYTKGTRRASVKSLSKSGGEGENEPCMCVQEMQRSNKCKGPVVRMLLGVCWCSGEFRTGSGEEGVGREDR